MTVFLKASVDDERLFMLDYGVFWMGDRSRGRKMLVRERYGELFNVAWRINSKNPTRRRFIMTGALGIGKSFFGLCWLRRGVKMGKAILRDKGASCFLRRPGGKLMSGKREIFAALLAILARGISSTPGGQGAPLNLSQLRSLLCFPRQKKETSRL